MGSTTISLTERHSRRTGGFSLVEVMIAAALGAVIMTAVMSSFIYLGRSGALLYNYTGLEAQARRAMEKFGQDTRMAQAAAESVVGNVTTLTLTVPHVASDTFTNTIAYIYDSAAGTLTRRETDTNSAGAAQTPVNWTILSNISRLSFNGWQAGSQLNTPASFNTADEVQISLTLRTQTNQYGQATTAVAAATNFVVSARFIMRNKKFLE